MGSRDAIRRIVTERGWRTGTALEDRVALVLHLKGLSPEDVAQQHRVGKYRLDFAWPDLMVALEADGWHHRSPEGAASDALRDSELRAEGWLVFRVDDRQGEDALVASVERVTDVLNAVARAHDVRLFASRGRVSEAVRALAGRAEA